MATKKHVILSYGFIDKDWDTYQSDDPRNYQMETEGVRGYIHVGLPINYGERAEHVGK